MAPTLASAMLISTMGLLSKAFMRTAGKSLTVEGMETLTAALREPSAVDKGKGKAVDELPRRRGVVTICNHISVVDDPMMWGMMPLSNYLPFATPTKVCRNSRWTLGASDIMFTNGFLSRFFTLGQVIETHRGGGIFQPAIDQAVKRLQEGDWVHVFPEGKVNQPSLHPEGGLWRFKWGVSRIIMDSEIMPEIIPIWISGFDKVMPEPRKFLKFLPRPGAKVHITIGKPLTAAVEPMVSEWRRLAAEQPAAVGVGGEWEHDAKREARGKGIVADGREEAVRLQICNLLQDTLQAMGETRERVEGKFDRPQWTNSVAGRATSIEH